MTLKKVRPYPGMVITESVIFEIGEYDFLGQNGIIIGADNIMIDGNGARLCGGYEKAGNIAIGNAEKSEYKSGSSPDNAKDLGFFGVGIYAERKKGVTIKNLKVSGFDIGMHAKHGTGFTIENCDFSDCFTDPAWGWDDHGYHGGILFEHMHCCCIKNCKATNVWDALNMRYSDDNKVLNNNFSHTSDTGLKLWNSSRNEICDNDFSYGIRIDPGEVHARDSAGVLIESGSNDNIFKRNNITHGGDGLFIRVLNGWMSTGNYFEENDCSYANNNAIEAWADGNTFVRNKANYSSYGFWLGGSDNTVLIGNEVAYNGGMFSNAPEAFGNAGISIVNASGSHIIIEDNYIHDNYGPGIAIRYKKDYPSFHWLIQGNRIENNKTKGKYKGHGIYVKNAKWIIFGQNHIAGNEGEAIFFDSNVSDIVFLKSGHQVLDRKVKASFTIQPEVIFPGNKVCFDAGLSEPGGDELHCRWDLGDGTVLEGVCIEHVYKEPGFYRMGLTVDNGAYADIAYKNIYVLPSRDIFGVNDEISRWEVSGNAKFYDVTRDTNYSISSYGSVCIKAGDGTEHKVVYPASRNLTLNIGSNRVFNIYIRYLTDAEPDWDRKQRKPVFTFFADDQNYVVLTPKIGLMERFFARNNEEKNNWQFMSVDLDDYENWDINTVGSGLESGVLNYIQIDYGSAHPGISSLWLDGICFTQKKERTFNAIDIALNKYRFDYPNPISSQGAEHSDLFAPISGEDRLFGDMTPRFATAAGTENGYYGVEFGCIREYDRVDVYFYANLTKTLNAKEEAVPVEAWIEMKKGDKWEAIPDTKIKPERGRNVFLFNPVYSTGVRVCFNCNNQYKAAINKFSVYNSHNVLTADKGRAKVEITSNRQNPIVLDAFEVKLNKELNGNGTPLGDLIARVYEVDAEGQLTECLFEKQIDKESIIPYEISKIKVGIDSLKSGKKYALALGQTNLAESRTVGDYYRWIAGKTDCPEVFGIYHNGETKPSDYDWGTAYMLVYCGGIVVDYSNESEHVGIRFGLQDMEYRYMTFTMPDAILALTDGIAAGGAGWIAEGENAEIYVTFSNDRNISGVNVWIDGVAPDIIKVICEGKAIAEKRKPDIGLVRLDFDAIRGKSFSLNISSTSGKCIVNEIELKEI